MIQLSVGKSFELGTGGFSEHALEYFPECTSTLDSGYPDKSPLSVQGRLREHFEFWEVELEASQFVLDIVKNGYKLPFIAIPQKTVAKNHSSALKHFSDSIDELVQSQCVRESVLCPKVCSPLQVVENAKGKLRLVIDLRYLNQFLHQCKFKYEGLNLISSLFNIGSFAFSFDLKSGYHHVDIHEDFQP